MCCCNVTLQSLLQLRQPATAANNTNDKSSSSAHEWRDLVEQLLRQPDDQKGKYMVRQQLRVIITTMTLLLFV
jgi:hypothetical protein